VVLARAYSECGNGEDAELELQAAVASFEKLGAEWEARRVEGLLGDK
jgi:hypothetical protein